MATAEAPTTRFDPSALKQLLDGRYGEGRERVREVLGRAEFAPPVAIPTAEYREKVLQSRAH